MGYQVYEDQIARDLGVERWAGYGVPAVCDFPTCGAEIDRGMGYRCEEYTGYHYFDEHGKECSESEDWDDEREEQLEGCGLHFCSVHIDHETHGDDVTPKPDTAEWIEWMLTDDSWVGWRAENPDRVSVLSVPVKGTEQP